MAATPSEVLRVALLSLLALATIAHGHNISEDDEVVPGPVGVGKTQGITYDERSLIIHGSRELLFSGSIHYTRSTPDMWPDLLDKARRGGLNVIQTYVFWNIHEPVQGQFNFEGNYDLVKFIKLVQKKRLWLTLRVGPFIQAEWNHGGLPYWLREVPGIIFRSDNEPFKHYMQKYVSMIIEKMKAEKLFASQGGPIILAQIENEYNAVQLAYRHLGDSYVQWAANMAAGLQAGVPWIMCKQRDAPDPVINTCNGRHCGDTFVGPNKPNKPALWTENWTAQFRVWGDPPSQRSAEDIAFSVARFFSKNGSLTNYYMYHGGTNLGRTSSVFSTTRYYDEAPLDEYGLQREPKWSHLKDLHKALKLAKKPLLWGTPTVQVVGEHQEIRVWENAGATFCAAFLTNNNSKMELPFKFRGKKYIVPAHSISILPDCETVVFNTQMIVSQHNSRNLVKSNVANKFNWRTSSEEIPTVQQVPINSKIPMELYGLLKDTTDYAWYTTSIVLGSRDMPFRPDILPVLRVASLGHALHVYVNGEFVGSEHGSHEEKSFVFEKVVNFKPGVNYISLLAMTVGLPDSGAYMEHRFAGPRAVMILGLNTGTLDLTQNGWGHQVGLKGEKAGAFREKNAADFKWTPNLKKPAPPLTWYRTGFVTPDGKDPVAIKMSGMGKGQIWINGKGIGRHWMSYLSPLGQPTQSEYHIPRSYLNPKDNLLVIFEEHKLAPESVEIVTVNRDTICSFVSDDHPPHVKSWERKEHKFRAILDAKPSAHLNCPSGKKIIVLEFVSYGDPFGACGTYFLGKCNIAGSKEIVEQYCKGKSHCTVPMEAFTKYKNECSGVKKDLAIQAKCDIL